MATAVMMPRQGNTVETCLIVEWKKKKGDKTEQGEVLCVVETDKATFEVESPASGEILDRFFEEGQDVPVLTNIAVIGTRGESYDELRPGASMFDSPSDSAKSDSVRAEELPQAGGMPSADGKRVADHKPSQRDEWGGKRAAKYDPDNPQDALSETAPEHRPAVPGRVSVSPRARRLAEVSAIDPASLRGSGPDGRIIERDILRAKKSRRPVSPAARRLLKEKGMPAPARGTGISGRILSSDLSGKDRDSGSGVSGVSEQPLTAGGQVEEIPIKGVRKLISERMLASLSTTAQITLNSKADARGLLAMRKRFKENSSGEEFSKITINTLVLYATAQALSRHPELNGYFTEGKIYLYRDVHLAFAVDTPRGLLVPVIRNADTLGIMELQQESENLSRACLDGRIDPDHLSGGTFTITNLGHLGIDDFTPILNAPQIGILGVGGINLRPVQREFELAFVPHIGLSLTINHQVVDGAPAARFLKDLGLEIAAIEKVLG